MPVRQKFLLFLIPWLICGVSCAVLLSLVYLGVGKFIFRFDLSALRNATETIKCEKMTSDNKFGLGLLVIFVLIMTLIGILPKDNLIISFFNKINLVGLAIIAVCLILFWRRKNGEHFVKFSQLLNGVSWEIIVMFAITIPLGNAMESEETGIMTTVLSTMSPVLQNVNPTVFMFIVIFVLGIMTQVCHNLVLTIAFTPMLAAFGLNYGIDPLLVGFLAVTVLQCATATPAASAQSAAVFANEQWVSSKWCYIVGSIFAIIAMCVISFAIYPLGRLLF